MTTPRVVSQHQVNALVAHLQQLHPGLALSAGDLELAKTALQTFRSSKAAARYLCGVNGGASCLSGLSDPRLARPKADSQPAFRIPEAAELRRRGVRVGSSQPAPPRRAQTLPASFQAEWEVLLGAVPNQDFRPESHNGSVKIAPTWFPAASLREARDLVVSFVRENDLGSGNWAYGEVRRNGKIVARISYQGGIFKGSRRESTQELDVEGNPIARPKPPRPEKKAAGKRAAPPRAPKEKTKPAAPKRSAAKRSSPKSKAAPAVPTKKDKDCACPPKPKARRTPPTDRAPEPASKPKARGKARKAGSTGELVNKIASQLSIDDVLSSKKGAS